MLKYILHQVRLLKYRFFDIIIRNYKSHIFYFDYPPVSGKRSDKADRLVDYCLGDNKKKSLTLGSIEKSYLRDKTIVLLQTEHNRVIVSAGSKVSSNLPGKSFDTKKVVEALISQRANIPENLNCWLSRGDNAGRNSDPDRGIHLSGMRPFNRRDVVLVPTACRNRLLGPNLQKQLNELRKSWVPWDEKSNSVWWGGALTGSQWEKREPRTLTRREVLDHFQNHPSDKVSLHLTSMGGKKDIPAGVNIEERFTKKSAFGHKCLILLPGNDIASGSSWYFAGNSVVLMPKPHLDHILYFEMEPWKHYVPIKNDPADILVKLQWVLDNQDEAKNIVANSHERLRWLCGPEYLWACNEVLRRIQ